MKSNEHLRPERPQRIIHALRALGTADLPETFVIDGIIYRHERTIKHDFFAATGFFAGAAFFTAGFFAAGLAAGFFAAGFLAAAGFFTAGFFAAGFLAVAILKSSFNVESLSKD